MFKSIMYPLSLLKALKLEEKGEYKKAMDVLLGYKKFIDGKKNKFPDYYIIVAELHARLGKYGDSEKLFLDSVNILDNTDEYNNDEKEYLKIYIYQWLKYIAKFHGNSLADSIYEKYIDELSYSEDKIRSGLKINFSMSAFQT